MSLAAGDPGSRGPRRRRGGRRRGRPPARERRDGRDRQDTRSCASCSPPSQPTGTSCSRTSREPRRPCSRAPSRAASRAARLRASSARRTCSRPTSPACRSGARRAREFEFRPGPIFANVVLVDEINRALPKAQSALLEGMAEFQVTVDGVSRGCPIHSSLIATENPIEQEGTFPLPEAQLDRFLLRTSLGYPTLDEEILILERQRQGHPLTRLRPVVDGDDIPMLRARSSRSTSTRCCAAGVSSSCGRRARSTSSSSGPRCARASRSNVRPAAGRSSTGAHSSCRTT